LAVGLLNEVGLEEIDQIFKRVKKKSLYWPVAIDFHRGNVVKIQIIRTV